jgi:lipoprotein-anchoring transpeptidase ErfK/SrfK
MAVHFVLAMAATIGVAVAIDPTAFGSGQPSVVSTAAAQPTKVPGFGAPAPDAAQPTSSAAVAAPPTTEAPVTAPAAPETLVAPAPVATAPAVAPPTSTAANVPPAVVVRVAGARLPVFSSEGAATPAFVLGATTEFGTPRVLLTTQLRGDWVRVLLPTPPNGSSGWVRASDVAFDTIADRLVVDRAARTLSWTQGGETLMTAPVAVGASSSPTPGGTFFVTDVVPEDPSGPYGRWAIALNGRPDGYVPTATSDLRIAIHGTNAPSSIGGATSNGCVRVDAASLNLLAASVRPGTPVVII